ncbi:serine/threonine-protein kinase meng-po, partial [Hyalella azteca]|uniref:Serine/threonine-protein kinase meng-po n=1 Tax=Hyalella azteca TaxID=294128 RepID=A0A8B7NV64_HYAAZ
ISLEAEYEVVAVLQEGWRGRVLLVEHRVTRNEVVLKATHKDATSRMDFFRLYIDHAGSSTYGLQVRRGVYERQGVASKSALDFMHSKDLVHRDINMDNILVFKSDFSRVKLCDFGSTRKTGSLLKKKTVWLPYAPPEIVDAVQNEGYHVDTAQDVWQFGILVYVLLTGQLPWQKADLTDPHYAEYANWRKRKTLRTPKRLSNFSTRFLRWMKRTLEPKPEKRASVKEITKYIDDKWLTRQVKKFDDVDNQSICYSTFSMHSSKIEKDKVLKALKDHGIETTVDRAAKRKRIHEWLERSISTRQNNVEEDDMISQSSDISQQKSVSSGKLSGSSCTKHGNTSSLNNLLDDGYQTGSSSNNSSMKMVQMRSNLNKSIGTINRIEFEKGISKNDFHLNQKAERQRRQGQQKLSASSTDTIVAAPNKKLLQRIGLSPARPPNQQTNCRDNQGLLSGTTQPNFIVQPQPGHVNHTKYLPEPKIADRSAFIPQSYRNTSEGPGSHQVILPSSKNWPMEASQLQMIHDQQIPPQGHQHQYHTGCNNTEQNYQCSSCHARSNTWERSESFELQRSRTDSFYVTESPRTSLSRHESEERLSDGSVTSVILRMRIVEA